MDNVLRFVLQMRILGRTVILAVEIEGWYALIKFVVG